MAGLFAHMPNGIWCELLSQSEMISTSLTSGEGNQFAVIEVAVTPGRFKRPVFHKITSGEGSQFAVFEVVVTPRTPQKTVFHRIDLG